MAAYAPNAATPFGGDTTWNLPGILLEVKQGLPNAERRLRRARELWDFYTGDSEKYIPFKPSEDALSWLTRPKEVSFITRKAVDDLTSQLYKPGPRKRQLLNDPAADAWYRRVCQDIHLNALMKDADLYATLQGLCAVSFYATGNPRRPVNYHLWPRDDFDYWCDPRDPRVPVAACTITKVDGETTRYQVWTRTHYYTFFKGKAWGYQPGGWNVTRFSPAHSGPHPYGALPFAFIPHKVPTKDLEVEGLGEPLSKVNLRLNVDQSNLALWVHIYAKPLGFVTGVSATWRPTFTDGGFVPLAVKFDSTEDSPVVPEAKYLETNIDIAALWSYCRDKANTALDELGVPLSANVQQGDGSGGVTRASGLSLTVQSAGLIAYTKGRQPLAESWETDVARLACRVGASPAARTDPALAAALSAAADDPRLRLQWSEAQIDMPGQERDTADKWELDQEITDPLELRMRRFGETQGEAEEGYRATLRRKRRMEAIRAEVAAEAAAPGADASADGPGGNAPDHNGGVGDAAQAGQADPPPPTDKGANPRLTVADGYEPGTPIPALTLAPDASPGRGAAVREV